MLDLERLPRPLADRYQRLKEETAKGATVAAAWALRDAWECGVRFGACLGLADLMRAEPRSETLVRALSILSKWDGLSLKEWGALMAAGCDPGAAPGSQRLLPGLTQLPTLGDGPPARPLPWFDGQLAPGAVTRDRRWYEAETAAALPALDAFYAALAVVLEGWVLAREAQTVRRSWAAVRACRLAPMSMSRWARPRM
jgi:hypothetical protein